MFMVPNSKMGLIFSGGFGIAMLTLPLHNDRIPLMEKAKEEHIQIRVSKKEKEHIRKEARKNGFDTISAFLLWLFRKSAK